MGRWKNEILSDSLNVEPVHACDDGLWKEEVVRVDYL